MAASLIFGIDYLKMQNKRNLYFRKSELNYRGGGFVGKENTKIFRRFSTETFGFCTLKGLLKHMTYVVNGVNYRTARFTFSSRTQASSAFNLF